MREHFPAACELHFLDIDELLRSHEGEMSDLTIVSALLLFMCTLSVVFAQAKNYETVTIEGESITLK